MIVITGAAGFIGSCILSRFNGLGREDLVIVDHLDDPLKEKNLTGKKYAYYFDKKDFLQKIQDGSLIQPIEAVIHMGACSSTTLNDAQYFEENNFLYSKKLALWCLENNCRYIYASSAATYGDGSLGFSDSDQLTPRLKPLNLYGLSKQKFDCWVLENGYQNKFVGLKFFNVFGPNEYHKKDMRSVIAKAYPQVCETGVLKLFKSHRPDYRDGEQKRDFIYVKDAVDIVMFFYDNQDKCGIFNAGTGEARSWNDVARALFGALDVPVNIQYIDMPDSVRNQYQYFTQAETEKLRKAGYRQEFTKLESGVKDYVSYLNQNSYL